MNTNSFQLLQINHKSIQSLVQLQYQLERSFLVNHHSLSHVTTLPVTSNSPKGQSFLYINVVYSLLLIEAYSQCTSHTSHKSTH